MGTESSDDDFEDFDIMFFDMLKFSVKLIFVNELELFNEFFEVDFLDDFGLFLFRDLLLGRGLVGLLIKRFNYFSCYEFDINKTTDILVWYKGVFEIELI